MPKCAELSPMMRHYMTIKDEHPDCLLFYRLGDFYELFFEDAKVASRELELVLTGRDCGLEERAPMCGVPFHAVDAYVNRLTSKGYKVAICEQLTDPKESKGLVERGIVRIITPGTLIDASMLDDQSNNYIMSVFSGESIGFAVCDVSTGEFLTGEAEGAAKLSEQLARFSPRELIVQAAAKRFVSDYSGGYVYEFGDWAFEPESAKKALCGHFKAASLEGFGLAEKSACVCAAGALMSYLEQTQLNALSHITAISFAQDAAYMALDQVTRKNLELTSSLREGAKRSTLFSLLNKTHTSMGARLLKTWINSPLLDCGAINARLNAVDELFSNAVLRAELKDALSDIYDMERICSRIAYGSVNAREALSLKSSAQKLPAIIELLSGAKSPALQKIAQSIDPLEDLAALLENAIAEDPPVGVTDGGLIKTGYNDAVDRLRMAANASETMLRELEARERESTGIKNLRVGYNKVFGYYIEVTKSGLSSIPFRYLRKQTLSNCERFITDELKTLENEILNAGEKLVALEYELFSEIRRLLVQAVGRIQETAKLIAKLDCCCALSRCAVEYDYVKPEIHSGDELVIRGGRHPVVERGMSGGFVANDALLNCEESRMFIITGPNMAGKSTYMRQIALITLMAHIGSFVPATYAKIPLTDRIFTRVGASDDLSSGQSTFMVEMSETANILRNAASRSLILLDEIGRGTSTYDGLSIAWAVCEYIADKTKIGAKTLFATHYHELSDLEGLLDGVICYRITARDMGDDIIFLRRIVRGGTDKSFGIQVAKLAGIPTEVINRANEIVQKLDAADISKTMKQKLTYKQASLFLDLNPEQTRAIKILRDTDVDSLRPVDALTLISDLKALLAKSET